MHKKIITLFMAAAIICGAASCSSDTEVTPAPGGGGTTGGGTTGGGTTGGGTTGGGGTTSDFTWSGTAPMSAKVNGTMWTADEGRYMSASIGGMYYILSGETEDYTGFAAGSGSAIVVSLREELVPGSVYVCNSSNSMSFTNEAEMVAGSTSGLFNTGYGGSGKVKIVDTAGGIIEGRFYGTFKALNGTSHTITEGYFKINK